MPEDEDIDEEIEEVEEEPLALETSILKSIMDMLGVDPNDTSSTSYAQNIMININSALKGLTQAGVGPAIGFRVTDATATWDEFLGDSLLFDDAKDYVYFRCRLAFDPPTAGTTDSLNKLMDEALWRCKINAEEPPSTS